MVWGNTSKNLPWTCQSGGSQTTHAMTRAAHAVGTRAVSMIQEVAAKAMGAARRPGRSATARSRGRAARHLRADCRRRLSLAASTTVARRPKRSTPGRSADGARRAGPVVAAMTTINATDRRVRSSSAWRKSKWTSRRAAPDSRARRCRRRRYGDKPAQPEGQTFGGSMLGMATPFRRSGTTSITACRWPRFHYSKPPSISTLP